MKILYFNEVCGFPGMFRHLTKEQHDTYFQTLAMYNIEWFSNIEDVFPKSDDSRTRFTESKDGFFEYRNQLYTLESKSDIENNMRVDSFFQQLTEEYNSYLDKPIIISYKEIEIQDLYRIHLYHCDSGSESVMYNE